MTYIKEAKSSAKCYCNCGHLMVKITSGDWRCSMCGKEYIVVSVYEDEGWDSTPFPGFSCECPVARSKP